MNIFDFFNNIDLTRDQKSAVESLQSFLKSDEQIFILQGYAGTGKTTLLRGLTTYLKKQEKMFQVLAPTGRAAKVLRNIVGHGSTIHRGIYNFDDVEVVNTDKDDAEKSFHYRFPVRDVQETHRIAIVDEASMVSDKESLQEFFTFGSGRLLSDLLNYMKLHEPRFKNKVIFVGDPAQLPPVTDSKSQALSMAYFQELDFKGSMAKLTNVLRQNENSNLLSNANRFRNLIDNPIRKNLYLDIDGNETKAIAIEHLAKTYCDMYPKPKIGNGVIITYSNKQSLGYNQAIRSTYFPGNKSVTAGDIVLINNNNYGTYETELYNGDLAQVLWAAETTETQSAPVYVETPAGRVKKNVEIRFRDVQLQLPDFDRPVSCKIIDSLINNPDADLTSYEKKAMFINFAIRFNEKQKANKDKGLPYHREGSKEFKEALRDDPYLRAMKVKYGYAITCHKAQGGEWNNVFVDFSNRVGYTNDKLRWCYTAITRSKEKLFVINPPDFRKDPTFEPTPIKNLPKLPASAIQYFNVPLSPFHTEGSHPCKSLKYYELCEKLSGTGYKIQNLASKDWQEIYRIEHGDTTLRIDGIHNKAGIFKALTSNGNSKDQQELLALVNAVYEHEYHLSYHPSSDLFSTLYSKISQLANELQIQITNIEEVSKSWYVNYFFRIEDHFAQIQFYFNGKGQFTYTIPRSEKGEQDTKLKELITKLA